MKGKLNLLADAANENDKAQEDVSFKNNATFWKHKATMKGETPAQKYPDLDSNIANVPSLNVELIIPLKCLTTFLKSLDLSFINCEVNVDLSWKKV